MKRSVLFGILTTIVVLIGLLIVGPQRIALADENTGDEELAQKIRDNSSNAQNQITAFTLQNGEATFAGLGADKNAEVEIGSVSKTFTTELLRQQVESGDIELETTVGDIIDVDGSAVADVTMVELANHTSGLPRLDKDNLGLFRTIFTENPYTGITQEDVFNAARNASLSGRGEVAYSNFGVALLGQLLAVNADSEYVDLVQENILEPAGMDSTYVGSETSVSEYAPRGLSADGRKTDAWGMDGYAPAGSIRSTAADMAKYAEFMLDNSEFEFGWFPEETGGLWHNGGTGGYSTMLIIDPEKNEAFFANANTPQGVEDLTRALRQDGE
ncbi:serine hydrolase domain-containing protein [Corynebacterium casei]|uniref:serine hydrolase domain-containing protein n=1 Tax=Corynebacterium casei TaxID=160386 RepID=UPI003F9682F8